MNQKTEIEIIEGQPLIFTTGAFLKPRKQVIEGKTFWCWVVEKFEDDSYINGELCDPREYVEATSPNSEQRLLRFFDES